MSQVRHRASTKARVIELYEAGWTKPSEIIMHLERDGLPVPSRNTLWAWTHPEKAAEQTQRDLEGARRWRLQQASFAWPGVRGPEWKLQRMRVLREAGLSLDAVAAVMSIDFPVTPISRPTVAKALTLDLAPRIYVTTHERDLAA